MSKPSSWAAADPTAHTLALPALSPAAAGFVREHPDRASQAVRVALEAAAAQFAALRSPEPGIAAALRPFVVDARPSCEALLRPEDAGERLAVSRATVYNGIEVRRLIGWRRTRQGTRIPAEQIVGPGAVVAGIDRVLAVIPEPRAAWRFLSEDSPLFETPQRPLDRLKAGRRDAVLAAARSWGEAFA